MEVQGMSFAVFRGIVDSIKGVKTVFYLDKEMDDRTMSRLSPSRVPTPIRRRESELSKENQSTRTLKKHEESKVFKRTLQCGALNGGIFLVSLLLFDYGILPLIHNILETIFGTDSIMGSVMWSWIRPFLVFIFQTIWVLPLFLLSKVVNCLWFQDIADSAYRYSRGRPQLGQSLSKVIADSLFSIAVQVLFLLQATLVEMIPLYLIGKGFALVHMCLLYALYIFEYKWFNMGWELHRRLTFIETNWPYFIGFGLPLAILTQITESYVINGCIFSILFPFFIVSGNEANPVSGVCNYPLHLFSPVIALSNTILNRSIGNTRTVKKPAALPTQPPQHTQQHKR